MEYKEHLMATFIDPACPVASDLTRPESGQYSVHLHAFHELMSSLVPNYEQCLFGVRFIASVGLQKVIGSARWETLALGSARAAENN
jgi:hypothetical protein